MSLSSEVSSLSTAIGTKIKEILTSLNGKQATLTSGTNIKTINNVSILGSGDLTISVPSHTHSIDSITDEHRLFNNMGDNHGTRTDFNYTPSNNYGFRYVQGNTNGPSWGGSQNYGFFAGLGNDYNGNYGSQFYWARDTVNPYISIRFREGDGWKDWTKISAGYADNANLLDGLDLHTGRNNEANKVVRTDGSGYLQTGWINTPSGTAGTINKIYCSQDDYIRYLTPSSFRAQLTDGVYQKQNDEHIVDITNPNATEGTWNSSDSTAWGTPRIGTYAAQYVDNSGYRQWVIPDGMDTCYISYLPWDSGGYVDVHGVQGDGGLVFLRRINTHQSVENRNEGGADASDGGNSGQHDGSTVTLAGTGLSTFNSIRFTIKSGRFHLTGMSFSSNRLVGSEGTGIVNWNQLTQVPSLAPSSHTHDYLPSGGKASDANLLDGLDLHTGRNNEANKVVRTDGNGYLQTGYINSSNGNENNNSNADRVWGTNGSDDYMRTYRTSALSVGYAASAGTADNIDGIQFKNANSSSSFVVDTQATNGIGYSTGYNLFGQTDGAVYASTYSADWQHQINGDFRSGQIAIRGKNSGTWQPWRTVLDSSNFSSYAAPSSHTHANAAPLASPVLTGSPEAPTPGFGTNNNRLATTSYVDNKFSWDGTTLKIQVADGVWKQVFPPIYA